MTDILWLNGTLAERARARIDPADRGFTLGDGVFETIRMENGVVAHAARHLARWRRGAAVLGIEVPFGDEKLLDALTAVARENGFSKAALRLTLTRGAAARGVLPAGVGQATVLISAAMLPAAAGPARVIVARRTVRNELSPLAAIKSLNYLDSVLARMEAAEAGADDALLLNTRGDVAEASAANVVLHVDGGWVTPRVTDGALPGIARELLLEAGTAVEARISTEALERAEAGFLINSLGTRAIAAIGARALHVLIPARVEIDSCIAGKAGRKCSFLKKRTKRLLSLR